MARSRDHLRRRRLANVLRRAKFAVEEGKHMMRMAFAALVAIGCAAGAIASPKSKGSTTTPNSAAAVNVENKRPKPLLTFEIVMSVKGSKSDTIVGKLEKPLAAGESVSVPLIGARGCLFKARWKFEDVDDVGTVDLCSDAHIVLID
jgi:hypothetical protein